MSSAIYHSKIPRDLSMISTKFQRVNQVSYLNILVSLSVQNNAPFSSFERKDFANVREDMAAVIHRRPLRNI